MKAAEMHCIKISDAHEHEILSKQPLLAPGEGNPTRFLPLQVMNATCILQEAGGVEHTQRLVMRNFTPPPPVDTSTYRHVRKKTRAYAIGTWEWRTFSFLAVSRLCSISPAKKAIARSSRNLTASRRLFYWLTRGHADRTIRPTCMNPPVIRADISARKHDIHASFSNITKQI